MITQQIKLNLIPGQVLPRVNASQYDANSRTLQMSLYNGNQVFNIASGMSAYIQGTKPDKTGFQYAATVTEGSNIVTFEITQQMTAVSGDVVVELVIVSGNDRIATINFILFVEAAALSEDTVISETDLPLIEEAAELAETIGPITQQVREDAQTASNAATAATAAQAAAEAAAEEAESWSAHPPYIGSNGNWYIYNTTTQQFEDSGIEARGPQGETGPQGPQGIRGEIGPQGPAGNGIASIIKTGTSGLVDTYTITFTDGTITTFTVTNGQDGQGAGDMTKAVYDSTNAVSDAGGIVDYVDGELQPISEEIADMKENYQSIKIYHNIPRLVPKDVTSYITDGTFFKRLAGTDGFELFEDLYVGDYIKMSRAISAYEQTQTYQATGSQYVTIAGLDTRMGDGDGGDSVSVINYHHAVMVPGQGFVGIQHFGRSRMNSSNDTTGGYVGSEMFITTIGAVATSGSTAITASINQQLYAEFGSHLKTIRQILSNAMDNTRYNRFGNAGGASSGWAWTTVQAVLMSEVEVYGSIVWSSSGFDTGNGNIQLPLFQHNKQAMNNRSAYYWLKDIASSARFCNCNDFGNSNYHYASVAKFYVRPRFILA